MANKYSYIAYIEGDTSGIVNAMKDVEERSKDLTRRMRVINEGLKFNPESVELLSTKFDTLSEQVENAKIKLEALKSVEEQAKHSRETGATTKEQYAKYIQELTKAENNYKMLEIAAGTAKTQLDNVKEALKQTAFATEGLGGKLSEIDKIGKSFDSELKEIDSSLRNNGGIEILEQKYDVLSQAIENTKNKLNELNSAQKNMSSGLETGTVSVKEQREYQREIEGTQNKLLRYQNELESVRAALDGMNASADSAVDGIRNVSDEASTVAESIGNIDGTISELKSQMSEINKSLQLNPGNVELIGQKYANLGNQINLTRDKLEQLKSTEQEITQKFASGEISADQYDAFRREILNTEAALRDLIDAQNDMIDESGHIRDVTDEMDDLGDSVENAAKKTNIFGDVLKANILSDLISSGINKIKSGVMDFAKQGITLASDLTEVQNVVDVTFGDGAAQIYEWADAAAESFGMSSLAAQEYNGTMGAMLKSMGLTDDKVKEMSMDMVGLAGDMASFYNLDVETVFNKIRSGISGETEPLKQLGINMSVANLEAYALSQGIETAYKKMTEAEKATLRYNYLMSVTADAQGDFARTSDSFANQQKILELQTQNLAASFGEKLLPSLNNALNTANEKIPQAERTVENIGKAIGKATEFAIENHEAILGLVTAYATFQGASKAGTFISELVTAFKKLKPATEAATVAQEANNAATAANPYVLAVAAIAALTVGLITYANSVDSVHNSIKDINKEVKELKKNTEESIESNEAEIAVFKNKAQRYEELLGIEKRTAGQEEELKELAEELQQYMPENTQLIDEQTGAYNSLADSIDSVSEAMRRRATLAAYEDEYTELVKQQIKAQKDLDEAQERLKKFNENGGKISANPFQNTAFISIKKDLDDATETLLNIEERKNELDSEISKFYEQESKQQIYTGETYADYMRREGERQLAEDQQRRADDLADYEENLKAKKEELDNSLALRRISEEKYYQEIGKYLAENKNTESKEYFELLGKYENYLDKKQTTADKAAEDEQKAEKDRQTAAKKAAEDAEKERVNAIKASWDKITAMRDRGQIDEAAEYKLKAQIVKKYCDENESTWDGYYKWLHDYTKKQEDKIADTRLKAWEDNSKKLSDTLSESYKALKSQKEQVKKDLQSIDLTETVKGKDGEDILVLKDLDAEIKKIDKYEASMKKLEASGASESLMGKIRQMNYADGSRQRYIDQLLSLSSDKLKLYYSDWERLQEKQESAAQNAVADKLDDLNAKTTDTVGDIFGKMPEEAYESGAKTAQSFLQGIIDNMDGLNDYNAISAILNASDTKTPDSAANGGSSAAGKVSSEQVISVKTPINLYINDKRYSTTIEDLIDLGTRTGGNVLNL